MRTLIAVALLAITAAPAVAGEAPKQNHHCKMPDGSMDMAKTKRECKAAKGTWAKDAPAAGEEAKPKSDEAKPTPDKPAK
jgi:hypothetical protein